MTELTDERRAELIEDRWEIGEDVCHSGWKNEQYHDITRALRELVQARRRLKEAHRLLTDIGVEVATWEREHNQTCGITLETAMAAENWLTEGQEDT